MSDGPIAPGLSLRAYQHRRLLRVLVDCGVWVVALYAASLLRLDFDPARLDGFEIAILLPVAWGLQAGLGWYYGLYRGRWINGSFDEVAALGRTVFATTAILLVVDLVWPELRPAPASSVIGAGILAFLAMGGARYAARQMLENRRRQKPDARRKRAIIFGAGEGGDRTIRSMLWDEESPYVPVALLDDDPNKRNLTIRGIRVFGDRGKLRAVAEECRAKALVIAVPTGDGALVRELSDLARTVGLEVRVVPSVRELLGGEVSVDDLRKPTESDLLGRHTVETDLHAVSEYITGKRVIVTGAGGSIGSELCRQLSTFAPETLIMVDRDESGLHAVQLSLDGRAMLDSDSLVLIDIRDRARVARLFAEIKPDVVFHAAALKHLPLLQAHPSEALKSNVWGTLSVLDAAAAAGVKHFVNISTDKAANAVNALGYSKRAAEGLTSHFGQSFPGTYLSVRFGNVLGSRGSVLTAFRAQLEAGNPLTVTHPDVTRYFMTIEEAVQLVIQAGAIGSDGSALVLDMGDPVRIYDVARQLAGSVSPELPIVFTGLRPGEKLHEDLFCEREQSSQSAHELIRCVDVPPLEPAVVRDLDPTCSSEQVLATLERLARSIDESIEADSPETVDLVITEVLEAETA
ncbi:MAG TPA: nucleoside-diphosphate sugar epimerase/dehydratase [Acidimicrobiia bacterium]